MIQNLIRGLAANLILLGLFLVTWGLDPDAMRWVW